MLREAGPEVKHRGLPRQVRFLQSKTNLDEDIFLKNCVKTYLEPKVGKYPPEPAAGKRGWHE